MFRTVQTFIIICIAVTFSNGQSVQFANRLLGDGIYLRGGVGHLAIKDQYISDEKYSGTSTSFGLSWLRGDSSSAYRLGFDYAHSSALRNNNVSAKVMQTGLNLDFLYSIGRFQLLAHEVFAYLGPSADIFLYYRQQNIASGGNAFFNAYSFALFFSFSANSSFVVPLSTDLALENSARIALLSFGGRLPELHDNNASFFKALTIFSGLRGYTEFLMRYELSDHILLRAGYRFEIYQSTSWDNLLSASDNVILLASVRI
jgi:hypothetical protein